ncbi:tRNA (adenosine(37)-N6)-threonylcarbamoyltransferase complex dimerization subunit type 1 TsaB [Geobacter sp. DSM 9736]|uniref:tRNA (adenosine(37)-N6)-threonylcarbamoyltransferase complex dimerization subunit type 1 TsaB n=1 Tax=Geobacter sp. DSM 9736 TaxID=1277350 RepID=UPI000B5094FC|nr:tRNA (adenosine(37)-N6)-threonylcarbamoyltransferase complex dimerization subunit type 1 TsaB [Geobacter sp. DSM 9736]SNB46388.1 tRNA threonylcarbamoyladenosine biosynthesis protein TsaB [Geobacter sp. DSM 9736]
MKILTIDTSTSACSVALTSDDRLIAESLLNVQGHQSTRVMEMVAAVMHGAGLDIQDIDCFGVALGPGSFTGVRIGVATVKALALATGKPVAGFSSLAMLSLNVSHAGVPVCPMFDARKKEIYAALYRMGEVPEPLVGDCVAPPALFLERLSGPVLFLGDGALAYRHLIEDRFGGEALFPDVPCHQPSAARGASLARQALLRGEAIPVHSLAPVYIRASEAELAKIRKDAL